MSFFNKFALATFMIVISFCITACSSDNSSDKTSNPSPSYSYNDENHNDDEDEEDMDENEPIAESMNEENDDTEDDYDEIDEDDATNDLFDDNTVDVNFDTPDYMTVGTSNIDVQPIEPPAMPNPANDEYVQGYVRDDGTYVEGYHRQHANDTERDNYSYEGNYNPWTGETGHRR